jgi:hypothetical protein
MIPAPVFQSEHSGSGTNGGPLLHLPPGTGEKKEMGVNGLALMNHSLVN